MVVVAQACAHLPVRVSGLGLLPRGVTSRRDHVPGRLGDLSWDPSYLAAFKFLALFSIPLFALDLLLERQGGESVFQHRSPTFRMATAMVIAIMIALFSANQANAFIYFQF